MNAENINKLMPSTIKSIRPFIGAEHFVTSQSFYNRLGYSEMILGPELSYFEISAGIGFYLQKYYVRDWVENSMLFVELNNLREYREELLAMGLEEDFPKVRISEVRVERWGEVFFMHDPSGVLIQWGAFNSSNT